MATAHDQLLIDTIARHFPEARVDGAIVWTGIGSLAIACQVESTRVVGGIHTASLFFTLRGDELGPPVFASMTGYGKTHEDAIVTAGSNWAGTFGPVLRAAIAGEQGDVEHFDAVLDGRPVRVFVDGLERAFFGAGGDGTGLAAETRRRFAGESWLLRRVVEGGHLPVLGDRPVVLSAFVFDAPDQRSVEIKVNGRDWPLSASIFDRVPATTSDGKVMLRELAIAVPQGPRPVLTRDAVKRTLAGLAFADPPAHDPTGWRGWKAHRGTLAAPMTPDQLAALEREIGPLPDDYRAFLVDVGRAGAGPGYGLLRPTGAVQRRLARGTFKGAASEGVLALAHAGCGVMWLLVLRGSHRGEVWVDASAVDGTVRPVARSFSDWYVAWLEASFRSSRPWASWETNACASVSEFARLIEASEAAGFSEAQAIERLATQLKPGAHAITSGESAYFDVAAHLDPCHACVAMAARLGVAEMAFAVGVAPLPGRIDDEVTAAPGVGRFFRKLLKIERPS